MRWQRSAVWLATAMTVATVTVATWEFSSGEEPGPSKPAVTLAGHAVTVSGIAFSPDGKQLATVADKELRIWKAATGEQVSVIAGSRGHAVAISPNLARVATVDREGITIYEATTGKVERVIDPLGDFDRSFAFRPRVVALCFSADGERLATAGSVARVGGSHGLPGGEVAIWNVKTGKAVQRFDKLSTGASSVALSGDGKLVAASTNGAGGELPEPGEAWAWEVESGKALHTFRAVPESRPGEFNSIAEVAISPNGKLLVAAIGSGSRGRPAGLLIPDSGAAVRLWDLTTGKEVFNSFGHQQSIARLAFSPNGKQVASAGADKTVRLWDCTTGKELHTIRLTSANIEALAFSPTDGRLAIAGKAENGQGLAGIWEMPRKP